MTAIVKLLAGSAAVTALASAAPAAAQYYPGYGAPGYGVPGYGAPGYGYGGGYAGDSQVMISQCVAAVQARLGGGYGGGGRVLGISRVDPRTMGGLMIRGVATSGRYAGGYGYGGGYGGQPPIDLQFRCKTDFRGVMTDVVIEPAEANYGGYQYTPYNNYDYSQYGYSRY